MLTPQKIEVSGSVPESGNCNKRHVAHYITFPEKSWSGWIGITFQKYFLIHKIEIEKRKHKRLWKISSEEPKRKILLGTFCE